MAEMRPAARDFTAAALVGARRRLWHSSKGCTVRPIYRNVRPWQGGPIRNRTRHLLGENLFASRFGQRVALQGKVLVYGRNAGIADQHRFRRGVTGGGR
jgi:hypothetical protein